MTHPVRRLAALLAMVAVLGLAVAVAVRAAGFALAGLRATAVRG